MARRRKRDPFADAVLAPRLAPVARLPRALPPTCSRCGKKIYDTEASAKLAIKRHSVARYPMLPRPYFDEACQAWHLSTKPDREAS